MRTSFYHGLAPDAYANMYCPFPLERHAEFNNLKVHHKKEWVFRFKSIYGDRWIWKRSKVNLQRLLGIYMYKSRLQNKQFGRLRYNTAKV